MKEINLDGFKKTLDPATINYLEEKLEGARRVDLRKISEKASEELRELENAAANDYLEVEDETKRLINEIEASDAVLSKLECLLSKFCRDLSSIKGEMTSLQQKSLTMNVGLNNRKKLSSEFSQFIESIMLEPQLIEDIVKADINEAYVHSIVKLSTKLANLRRYDSLENKSVKEIEPELTKLKLKACERVKGFISQQIDKLKRPKTNIQIIQQNDLVNYRVFLYFLKEHSVQTFLDLSQNYAKLLSKIYANNFKVYLNDLNKLLNPVNSQPLHPFSDNVSQQLDNISKSDL